MKSAENDLPDELVPFKIKAALARANGKPQLLRKLMLGFCTQYASAASELRGYHDAGRLDECERLVHSVKSVTAMLEATDLTESLLTFESAIRSGLQDGLGGMIDVIEERLLAAIEAASTLNRRAAEPTLNTGGAGSKGHSSEPRPTVLLIDDSDAIRELMADALAEFHILMAARGPIGIDIAAANRPDLILLDIGMPDMDGYEVLRRLRDHSATARIPVIFVTGYSDPEAETRGLNLGAVDYVTKPINPAVVRARVRNQIKLRRAEADLLRLAAKQHFDEMAEEMKRRVDAERNRELQLKMKDDFLSHVSHELRSPLAAILSFISLIIDGLAGEITEDQDKYLKIASRNAAHLQAMVEDILQATALGNGKLSIEAAAVDIVESIEYALDTLQAAAAKKAITLSRNVASNLQSVHGDPVRIRQILTILLDNAVKFTPEGGSIQVEATPFGAAADFLLVTVVDSGCGIAPAAIASIFERLYQVEQPELCSRGLGLGLHIAKELVIRQGGKIWVESEMGHGTKFSFMLPTPAHAGLLAA